MTAAVSDSDSDYGWDLSLEEDVHQLLTAAATASAATVTATSTPLHATADAAGLAHDDASSLAAAAEPAPAAMAGTAADLLVLDDTEMGNVSYPDLSNALAGLSSDPSGDPPAQDTDSAAESSATTATVVAAAAAAAAAAVRSPLARFRSYPRKPLSVTDLTSGAWCELQYEYTLTRLPGGRRTRTPAMRAGTKVHARLEEEVHTTVRVDVASKEDMHGLKLWNMVQGLRTLRETGLTREFEIWGVVDDQLVSGIIDALSYTNPNPAFEAEVLASTGPGSGPSPSPSPRKRKPGRPRKSTSGPAAAGVPTTPTSSRITDFFSSPSRGVSTTPTAPTAPSASLPPAQKIYITDIKTRGSRKLPSGAAMRPTKIQLFLYHRFLSTLAAGRLDFFFVFRRYGLDPDAPFSDGFLAQIGLLHDEIFDDPSPIMPSSSVPADEPGQIRYRSLRSLVQLVQAEAALTFPHGAGSVGRLVAAEYRLRPTKRPPRRGPKRRAAATDSDGKNQERNDDDDDDDEDEDYEDNEDDESNDAGLCIGTNVIPVDDAVLDRYVAKYLEWWRGERAAKGVDIEEAALKCGYCEFAADCDWRQTLDGERVRRVRERLANAKPMR